MIPGQVVWVVLDPVRGREQGGRRPAVVISSSAHARVVDSLVIVTPCTTNDRGWPNHVRLTGPTQLSAPTFAMTEQPRTVTRARIVGASGFVDDTCLAQITAWVHRWIVASPTSPFA